MVVPKHTLAAVMAAGEASMGTTGAVPPRQTLTGDMHRRNDPHSWKAQPWSFGGSRAFSASSSAPSKSRLQVSSLRCSTNTAPAFAERFCQRLTRLLRSVIRRDAS